jgi:hypothetical protein
MREDFDYVTFASYESDMADNTQRAVAAIGMMRERAERAEQALAVVVLAAGGVTVPYHLLQDRKKIELITWRDEANHAHHFEAKRS